MSDARTYLEAITARTDAASKGPWGAGQGVATDETELVTTREQKAAFLALSLNDDESPLWLVDNTEVIPAATGDGPNAKANAEFIAHSRVDLPRVADALLAVLEIHRPNGAYWPGGLDEAEYCKHDRKPWPCPTVSAITGALEASL